MIEQKDIARVSVACDTINFSINRDNVKPGEQLNFNIQASWGIYSIRQDQRGIKSKVNFILKSAVLSGEIEVVVVVDFIKEIPKEELVLKENQKFFALFSVDYVIQWIADISSKMGIPPFILSTDKIVDLIKAAE